MGEFLRGNRESPVTWAGERERDHDGGP